jgi:hypothetical protein
MSHFNTHSPSMDSPSTSSSKEKPSSLESIIRSSLISITNIKPIPNSKSIRKKSRILRLISRICKINKKYHSISGDYQQIKRKKKWPLSPMIGTHSQVAPSLITSERAASQPRQLPSRPRRAASSMTKMQQLLN